MGTGLGILEGVRILKWALSREYWGLHGFVGLGSGQWEYKCKIGQFPRIIILSHTTLPSRLVLSCSMLYQLFLIFILFQSDKDCRKLLSYLYPDLGEPLEEIDYR